MLTPVEALIKCQPALTAVGGGYAVGDILVILPSGHAWGTGDLQGKTILCMDLDLPYGAECMTTRKCHDCAHQGIDWQGELKDGAVGLPRVTCPKEALTAPDMEFVFAVDAKGMVGVRPKIDKKRRAKVDIAALISAPTLSVIQSETSLTEGARDARLADARRPDHKVSVAVGEVKE